MSLPPTRAIFSAYDGMPVSRPASKVSVVSNRIIFPYSGYPDLRYAHQLNKSMFSLEILMQWLGGLTEKMHQSSVLNDRCIRLTKVFSQL
jgi:hypothetical protein